jgi:hypothetical protein
MQTTNDSDPAELRYRNKSRTQIEVRVAEESSRDSNTTHAAEVVGYVVIK